MSTAPGPANRRRLPLDPRSWTGALVLMIGVLAVLWIVQFVNAAKGYDLDRHGLIPRRVDGLWGVVTEPFLHASYDHLLSNSLPLVGIGWLLMLAGGRTWLLVTAIVVVIGGLLTWAAGPGNTTIVGASGMIFGWMGYLLARAYFTRKIAWILGAVMMLLIFGTLLGGLLPQLHSNIAWQAHVFGFLAGLGAGIVLHRLVRTGRRPALPRRSGQGSS